MFWELAEFPAILAAATAPYARELAPTQARSRSSSWARRAQGARSAGPAASRGKTAARLNTRDAKAKARRAGLAPTGFRDDAGAGGRRDVRSARGGFVRGVSRARVVSSRGVGGRLERVEEEAEGGEDEAEKSAPDESDAERASSRSALRAGGAV